MIGRPSSWLAGATLFATLTGGPAFAHAQEQSRESRASEVGVLGVLGVAVVGELAIDAAHLLMAPSGAWIRRDVTTGEPRRVMAGVELGLGLLEWAAGIFALTWRYEDPGPWQWSPVVATPLFVAGLLHVVLGASVLFTHGEAPRPVSISLGADASGAWLNVGGIIDG